MRKFMILIMAICFTLGLAQAGFAASKEYKLVAKDARHQEYKAKKWTTSNKKFKWKMSDMWGGFFTHKAVQHFCDSVKAASGGRLVIKAFTTGEVCGAGELFDSVANGTLDAGHGWIGAWRGKDEAFTAFASVPFGMDSYSYSNWYYGGDGEKLLGELFAKFGMKAFFAGNAGQELGMFTKKPVSNMLDFAGLKVRTVGWWQDILTQKGISVTPLPGSEVYLALERGVIDAAEFSSPAFTYPMGFHEIAKYVLLPGMHQPSAQHVIFINDKSWNKLPDDLKAIVQICARETQAWSTAWHEYANAQALQELKKEGVKFTYMDKDTLNEMRKLTKTYIDSLKKKNPFLKKVIDSQEAFCTYYAPWRDAQKGVAYWPYEEYITGKHMQ